MDHSSARKETVCMNRGRFGVALPLALASILVVPCRAQTASNPVYLDPSQPINVRVNDLVEGMTLEEKASQLVNQSRAIPRLHIPAYDWWSEALHGVAYAGTATVFPEPIGLAATFDDSLIHEMAVVIGTEARAKHNQALRLPKRRIGDRADDPASLWL
jgi:beta-glucosidase